MKSTMNRRAFLYSSAMAATASLFPMNRLARADTVEVPSADKGGIRVIELTGTPRERGRIHGEEMRAEIQGILGAWKQLIESGTGLKPVPLVKEFIVKTNFDKAMDRWTPGLTDEIKGMAEGADVDYETLFMFNCTDENEWYLEYRARGLDLPIGKACSALGVYNEGAGTVPVIAQNLDIASGTEGFEVLFHLKHDDSDLESYIFSVAGLLGIIGLSNAPVGVVNNSLPQLNHRINGLPVNCVVRGLLEQPSYEAAVAFVQKANHASGQNYIIGGPDGSAMFECSANEVARVPEAEGIRRQIHTNHPLVNTDINEVPELAVSTSSSNTEVRLNVLQQRILETTSDITLGIIKDTLSSHDDPENPVCRHHNPENPGASFTAASVIYEMSAPPVMHIAPGPPCETEFESYTF